jgi:hypothetical protein
MRTRRVALLVLLSFLWLVIASCAPHAEDHAGAAPADTGHCHHQTEPHSHDYFAAVPTTVAPLPVAEPVAVDLEPQLSAPEPTCVDEPRSRTGRAVLIDLSIART